MSVRKIAVLLAAGGIAVGLIGGGISAQFTGQVSGQEDLDVGTFGCKITSISAGALTGDTFVYYDAGTITKSEADSKPLSFTVASTGTIPVVLNISATPLPSPFTDLLGAPASVTLTQGQSHTFNAGIGWPELNNSNLGQSASIAYVVNCNEVGASPVTTISFSSEKGAAGLGNIWDTITGAGFLPNKTLSIYMYRFGSPTPVDLLAYASIVNNVTDGSGALLSSFEENCVDGDGVQQTTDQPMTVWASDGTRSAIGTGIIKCSLR